MRREKRRRRWCELIKGERRRCCQCLKENKSQTPCTWTCTGRLSATKSRMHSCVLSARWTEAHVTLCRRHSCSAPSLDQASTNSTPAFDLLSHLGLPLWRLRRTPLWNLAVVWEEDLACTQVFNLAETQLVKRTPSVQNNHRLQSLLYGHVS